MLLKVFQIGATSVYKPTVVFFKEAQKVTNLFWLLFVANNFQKSPNLVTLVGAKQRVNKSFF